MCTREELISVERLKRDIKQAAISLSDTEARFLVDAYYQMQADRIRAEGQVRSMDTEPHAILSWLGKQSNVLETQVKGALDVYSNGHPIGKRMRTIIGIGPVISAGFLAHIDITKANTAGAIWRFAGQDPTSTWSKGEKRPHNASLKTLCWKLGESFVKFKNHEHCFYGRIYDQRKTEETTRNQAGEFAEQAELSLERKRYKKTTDAYKCYIEGKLPPAHIHARAKRYAVKMFLSHLHEVWYEHHHKKPAPAPYVMVHAGHTHKVEPPF